MRTRTLWPVLLFVTLLGLAALACSPVGQPFLVMELSTPDSGEAATVVTPSPSATEPAEPTATPTAESSPTSEPVTPTVEKKATPTTSKATATAKATTAAKAARTPTPAWPAEIVVSEADVKQLAAGAAAQGIDIQGLDVQFKDGSMVLSADNLRYGFVSARNLVLQGRPLVANGRVTLQVDSVQPNNLVTAALPSVINQMLGQAFEQWYVEDLQVQPGQLVLTVRPR